MQSTGARFGIEQRRLVEQEQKITSGMNHNSINYSALNIWCIANFTVFRYTTDYGSTTYSIGFE